MGNKSVDSTSHLIKLASDKSLEAQRACSSESEATIGPTKLSLVATKGGVK